MNKTLALIFGITTALALGSSTARADGDEKPDVSKLPPAAAKTNVTYAADIKPIFENASCTDCHGEKNPKGKLNLTTLEGVLKGGKEGKVVVPGKVDKSPLVFAVAHVGDPDEFLPPADKKKKVEPLTKDQVGLIRAWVEQGAK